MNIEVQNFLATHRVCVFTTLLLDGSPHAATLHYSHKNDPLEIYLGTTRKSKKMERLLSGERVKASVVVGFSEEEWKTLQMDGEVRIARPEELEEIYEVHYTKHPDARVYKTSPKTVILVFIPSWWRFSDYNTDPPKVISSEGENK